MLFSSREFKHIVNHKVEFMSFYDQLNIKIYFYNISVNLHYLKEIHLKL